MLPDCCWRFDVFRCALIYYRSQQSFASANECDPRLVCSRCSLNHRWKNPSMKSWLQILARTIHIHIHIQRNNQWHKNVKANKCHADVVLFFYSFSFCIKREDISLFLVFVMTFIDFFVYFWLCILFHQSSKCWYWFQKIWAHVSTHKKRLSAEKSYNRGWNNCCIWKGKHYD